MQYISLTLPEEVAPEAKADLILEPVVALSDADAFDGFELQSIIVDLSARIPLIAGSLAATLVAINKSIDEAKKIAATLKKNQKRSRLTIDDDVYDLEDLEDNEINLIFEDARRKLSEKAETRPSEK